jgi:hypothetical protein
MAVSPNSTQKPKNRDRITRREQIDGRSKISVETPLPAGLRYGRPRFLYRGRHGATIYGSAGDHSSRRSPELNAIAGIWWNT